MTPLNTRQNYETIREELVDLEKKYNISSIEFYDAYLECRTPSHINNLEADRWATLCDKFILHGGFLVKDA
jgi:hypothetical protein